jgi:alpha-L-rhamnosidase
MNSSLVHRIFNFQITCPGILTFIIFFYFTYPLSSQTINPDILKKQWDASWITVPGASPNGYGVYMFRKGITLTAKPSTFVVHISADNRYKLYINEKLVSLGPARGDLYYWNFETVDLAPYLSEGKNIVSALVWNEGDLRPEAQISWRTGFIMQGDTPAESAINTNGSWKCSIDKGYSPLNSPEVIGYYVTGPGECIDMRKNVRGWKSENFDDSSWSMAVNAFWRGGSPKGLSDAFGWMLVPSSIPPRELTTQRLLSVRESDMNLPKDFPAKPASFTVAAHSRKTILLDQGFLTNAYITFLFSKGKDAGILIKYTEALFIPANSSYYKVKGGGYMGTDKIYGKGNRDEVKEKIFLGKKDSLISDGSMKQEFTSLYWRTFRYILLSIETKDEPLVIEDFYGTFTGYPFKMNARFESDSPSLQKVLDIGWRTARLCAMETYVDCPFYEQLQYIGDSRIQAMVSFYNSGDDRLVRNALNLMDHSRIAEGVTLSRHPSFSPQLIPTFSMWYIGMLHDYWMYRPDSNFVKEKIHGTREVLAFFNKYQQQDGSLKGVPYWLFTDWVDNQKGWSGGVAPIGKDGCSAVLDLQLLLTYQAAAELEYRLGSQAFYKEYLDRAALLKKTIQQKYWDATKGMYADTPEKDVFSQHANTLAILTGMLPAKDNALLARKMLEDHTLAPASIYFKYYLHLAFVKAGMGNDYISWLDKWFENISMGMSTWAEDSNVNGARSDCHAWGASPNIEFYRIILGINTDAPGFSRVKIEPHLGKLKTASGEMPHPKGKISVSYKSDGGKWNISIVLPDGLNGSFVWSGKTYALNPGETKMSL